MNQAENQTDVDIQVGAVNKCAQTQFKKTEAIYDH